jgi:two-component sensor histidine kinase/CheY-like chemotaxis protein
MVDDSASDRNLCRVLLEEVHGPDLEFYGEQRAIAGLRTCKKIRPDVLLLGHQLPDMSGVEFLRRLHETPVSEPEFAVVMLVGWAGDQAAVEALRAGAQDYLIKDRITADGLSLAVQKAMQKVGLLRVVREERDRLARSLAEKEVLLKEVHHRVKNNLQVIASLLRLQAASTASPELASALEESQHRVESMALIHEQLYESGDLREIDLAEHAAQLLDNLLHSYGADPARIRGIVRIPVTPGEPLRLDVHRAIPAGLILNELISNALKHAFAGQRNGTITVEGERCEGNVTLTVRDDGVGLSQDAEAGSRSLGLRIVEILARQLHATLTVQSGQGAAFRITFPERQG